MFQFGDHNVKGSVVRGITDRKKRSGRINKNMVNDMQREIDQDKKLSKRLIQSIPKKFLAFIDADGWKTPKEGHLLVIGGRRRISV